MTLLNVRTIASGNIKVFGGGTPKSRRKEWIFSKSCIFHLLPTHKYLDQCNESVQKMWGTLSNQTMIEVKQTYWDA